MKECIKSILRPIIRKLVIISEKRAYRNLDVESIDKANDAIRDILKTSTPASIGKMGGTELNLVKRCLRGVSTASKQWKSGMHKIHVLSGIFPEDNELMKEYCYAFLDALSSTDVLAIYYNWGESKIMHTYCPNTKAVNPSGLEPFSCEDPWIRDIGGKNVLVIHPFMESIKRQYEKRYLIWGKRRLLPDFNLLQIKMPLSNALVSSKFNNWKEQLDDIKRQMDGFDYDIALVGAGAYSLLITQHAKASGKIGIHLGGSTQILFGIKGERWINNVDATKLFNEHWVRPLPEETPQTSKLVEDGCYW